MSVPRLDELRATYSYDPESGLFTHKKKTPRGDVGAVAGSKCGNGYWMVRLEGKKQYAHRLAFLWMHGREPNGLVDHINGDKLDNRASNLREVTPAQNQLNRKSIDRRNKSGVTGVFRHGRKWIANFSLNGQTIYLGTFGSIEEASEARDRRMKSIYHSTTETKEAA